MGVGVCFYFCKAEVGFRSSSPRNERGPAPLTRLVSFVVAGVVVGVWCWCVLFNVCPFNVHEKTNW